jgi:hypothetical protein
MPKLLSLDGGGSWALIQVGALIVPVSRGEFVSMSPRVQPIWDAGNRWDLPNFSTQDSSAEETFTGLTNLAMDAVEDDEVALIDTLTDAWIADGVYNQPVRTNLDFACEIGHRFFSQAKKDWGRS